MIGRDRHHRDRARRRRRGDRGAPSSGCASRASPSSRSRRTSSSDAERRGRSNGRRGRSCCRRWAGAVRSACWRVASPVRGDGDASRLAADLLRRAGVRLRRTTLPRAPIVDLRLPTDRVQRRSSTPDRWSDAWPTTSAHRAPPSRRLPDGAVPGASWRAPRRSRRVRPAQALRLRALGALAASEALRRRCSRPRARARRHGDRPQPPARSPRPSSRAGAARTGPARHDALAAEGRARRRRAAARCECCSPDVDG